ncbi:tail tubular protein B [Pelagibacter phage HTVC131P]|nr:tail tubular protein B [Pelagibacter phage HTVC131P]
MGSVVSQSIPNFLNGMSQQTPTQRGINQGEDQVNLQNGLVDGLSKRPPLDFVATLDGSNIYSNKTKFWSIQRDADNQFIVALYNGGIKVFDLLGNEKTVTVASGSSYLTSTNPRENFKLVNIADYTFIANTATTVAADSTTSAAKVEEFLIVCKLTNYGREYKVALKHPSMAQELEVIFQLPSGNDASTDAKFRDTNKITDILLYGTSITHWDSAADGIGFKGVRTDTNASVSTTQGLANYSGFTSYFTFEAFDSVIYGKPTDQNANYTITTSDGSGNTAMYAIRDEIQDFSKLPFYGKEGVIIKITGEEGDTLSDYYVNFSGKSGVWNETIAPATSVGLDNSTMPHALINNNNGTFTFQQLDWTDRVCGDIDTNPNPTFVGKKINNLTFYKNRLGILSGENLVLTENASFFNYFATTSTQVLDTDPIDIAASGTQVNTLKNSVGFNESLLIFSDTAQYKLDSAAETITPTTAILNAVSTFEHDAKVTPVSAGKFAYFAQARTNNTAIREYFADDDTLTNDGLDITVSVQNLIPSNCYQIVSNTTEDTLIFLTSDTADSQTAPYSGTVSTTYANTMYIYKYFFDGGEKVQNAWSKWTFTGVKIIGAMSLESFIYVLASEGTTTKLLKIDLRNLKDTTIGHGVYLDLKTSVTGTYDAATNLTTFTSPYGVKTGLIAVDRTNGNNYTATNTTGSTYTIVGNHTALYIGVPYESKYTMSTQFVRENTGRGLVAVTSGRYQIRNISFNFENSGFFQVEVTPENRDTFTTIMNGYVIGTSTSVIGQPAISTGTLRVPVQAENTQFTLDIKSSSHLPMYIAGAEVEGYYHNRARRI